MLCLKQQQQLRLSQQMQQSLHVLQLPIVELAEWLKAEIEQNPILEYSASSLYFNSREKNDEVGSLCYQPSLFEHLMGQAINTFASKEELEIAEYIIGNLDERGFLEPLEFPTEKQMMAQSILNKIQTFDPVGVATSSLRESLLLQLCLKKKQTSLAFLLIDQLFEDLLQHRFLFIQKKLHCSFQELQSILREEITLLNFHPGLRFRHSPVQHIVPDVFLKREGESWSIEVNDAPLPTFKICSNAITAEERGFFQPYAAAAKWLSHIISRRKSTLRAIALYLLQEEEEFFDGTRGSLKPLSAQEVAVQLGLHESTISRAIANKYLFSPIGLVSFRAFFHQTMRPDKEDISLGCFQSTLRKLIAEENKRAPLTDLQLCRRLQQRGFRCSRRTVTKYRQGLQLPIASRRRYL
jgi:RNA polymerase sigma-54 factor